MKRFRFPEILIGVFLTVAVFAVGYSVSSVRYLPSNETGDEKQHQISNFADILIAVWDYLTKDAITLFTLVLAFSTVWLAVSTRRLWQETKDGGDTTKRLADTAARQAEIQLWQHNIGRLQLIAQHRPRLRVRHVQLRLLDRIIYAPGDTAQGGLVVVNAGSTRATIIQSGYLVITSGGGLPIEAPDFVGAHPIFFADHQHVLGVGESFSSPVVATFTREYSGMAHDLDHLYILGFVRYQDEGGADRFMGFCRQRMPDGRFRPVDDPDYEYED